MKIEIVGMLHPAEMRCLFCVAKGINYPQKIADHIKKSQPAANQFLLKLEEKGFVVKRREGAKVIRFLTPKAVEIIKAEVVSLRKLADELDGCI